MCTKRVLVAIAAVCVSGVLWAQPGNAERPAPPPQGQPPGGRGGPPGGPGGAPGGPGGRGGMMGAFWQLRQFDANGDVQVDEKELNAGLDKIKARADDAYASLLKAFDANGRKLTGGTAEGPGAHQFMSLQQYDRNRDWQLDKRGEGPDQLADAAHANDGITERFDKDGDGKLSPEETAAAKEALQAPWQQGQRREGGGGPRPGGDRGPGQPPPPQPAPGGEQKPNP